MDYNREALLYRSARRGCRETDLLFGNFVIQNINSLTNDEIQKLTELCALDDYTLHNTLVSESNDPLLQKVKMHAKINIAID